MGVTPNTLYTPPIFPQLCIYFMIKNCQIIFLKVVYRTPPENAFMHVYFYFYSVVKCGNCALGINERIKKSSRTQKRTQTHHCRKVIEGSPGGPYQKDFEREPPRANHESACLFPLQREEQTPASLHARSSYGPATHSLAKFKVMPINDSAANCKDVDLS
jgi:hypothetical protein